MLASLVSKAPSPRTLPVRAINTIVIHCSATPDGDSLFRGPRGERLPDDRPWPGGYRTPVQVIDAAHLRRGFLRQTEWRNAQNPSLEAIGYHYVLYTNGAVATGRHEMEIGAHARGHNADSIGICMIGTERFHPLQWLRLRDVVMGIIGTTAKRRGREVYRVGWDGAAAAQLAREIRLRIVGHRDLSPDANGDGTIEPHEWLKTCPGFNVSDWLDSGMMPVAGHVLVEDAS